MPEASSTEIHNRAEARRVRPPTLTREQRLRRTMVGAGALVLVVGGATMALDRDSGGSRETRDSRPRSSASTPPTASVRASSARASTPTPSRSVAVIPRGTGTFSVLPVTAPAPPATGRTVRYTIEAEGGLGTDNAEFARLVAATLADPRGWQRKDGVRFVNVTPSQAARGDGVDLRVTLASPARVDELCAPLRTRGTTSCHNRGRVVINTRRWLQGADAYRGDLAGYRFYVVSHEMGHGIGHGHVGCPGAGRRAPVMLQQTLGLQGCTKWPYPQGA